MARAFKTCSTPGCGSIVAAGRCEDCGKAAEQIRGTAAQRGYGSTWARRRAAFLRKPENIFCRLCPAVATVADHWPLSRRELAAQGVHDPDAPHRLRPLCAPCHSKETVVNQPGGFNAR